MAKAAREILDLIEEIGGEAVARRAAKGCSGRRLSMTAAALSRSDHPLRIVIGKALAMQLIDCLDATTGPQTVRFPEAKQSAFLRDRRRRAAVIRRAVLDGQSVEDTARAAKVHSRTVIYHRARLRAEGLLNSGGVHG